MSSFLFLFLLIFSCFAFLVSFYIVHRCYFLFPLVRLNGITLFFFATVVSLSFASFYFSFSLLLLFLTLLYVFHHSYFSYTLVLFRRSLSLTIFPLSPAYVPLCLNLFSSVIFFTFTLYRHPFLFLFFLFLPLLLPFLPLLVFCLFSFDMYFFSFIVLHFLLFSMHQAVPTSSTLVIHRCSIVI